MSNFARDIRSSLEQAPLVAVLVIDEIESVKPLGEALLAGGIRVLEVTLRTAAGLKAIKLFREFYPQLCVGAGTVLRPEQVIAVKEQGAHFAVAPGLNRKVIEKARELSLDFAPGIMTPSDIETALEYDCDILKFFPAETSGGLRHLQSMAGPYAHKKLRFIPLGGVNQANIKSYLANPLIIAVGGSWIATREDIKNKRWRLITEKAKAAF